ncbi:MAG: DUF4160 domain-containing protein [Rhizobiaceae bacterium]
MPTIARIGNIKIQVFADDHNPPHFHVVTPDGEALVSIGHLRILRGDLRRKDFDAVSEWANRNLDVIEDAWNSLNG